MNTKIYKVLTNRKIILFVIYKTINMTKLMPIIFNQQIYYNHINNFLIIIILLMIKCLIMKI